MTRVLVVAAHPDDEVLGAGATAAKHADAGDEVWSLVLGEGVTSRAGLAASKKRAALKSLRAAAREANKRLGVKRLILREFADNRFDTVARLDLVHAVEAVVAEFKPSVIYTHGAYDLNVDHQCVAEAVKTATRPLPGSKVAEVYSFEIASSTEWRFEPSAAFHPDTFVDVSATLDRKLRALAAYEPEMRRFPHPRSAEYIRALAQVRGGQSGLPAAEAFKTVRRLVR